MILPYGTYLEWEYLLDQLQATQFYYNVSNFKDQVWASIKLQGTDSLLVGCIYRSPSHWLSTSVASLFELFSGWFYMHMYSILSSDYIIITLSCTSPSIIGSTGITGITEVSLLAKVSLVLPTRVDLTIFVTDFPSQCLLESCKGEVPLPQSEIQP